MLLFRPSPAVSRPKTQHLLVGARIVAYALRQDRRRLSMTIDERGLRVGAPRNASQAEIEAFIRKHGDWVVGKIDEHARQTASRSLAVRDGACLPLLGGEVRVRITAGGNRIRWREDALELAARTDADLEGLARRALQRRALDHFAGRIAHYAERLGCTPPPLALSSARTRWGSCSRQSGIRLNWRLIHLPPELIDYVVAHELAHLVEMNHSPRFWGVVENLYPDWRTARAALKRRAMELPIL